MSELGERLRRERVRRGDRQMDVAARMGISQPSYHRWEVGENYPDDRQFAKVAGYLGCTTEEVWRMVHGDEAPASLSRVQDDVEALRRDVEDLRELRRLVAELREQVAGLQGEALADGEKRNGHANGAKSAAPAKAVVKAAVTDGVAKAKVKKAAEPAAPRPRRRRS